MQYWKAHYKDMLHDTAIEIINTEEDYNTEPLSFTLDNITFCGTSLSDFHLKDETQYVEACKKFSLLKWGGHNSKFTSPYGSDDYGLMLCFCRHKNDCLKVNSKDDFFSFLEGKDYDGRQETYLCGHYCLRDKASGYRGLALLYRTRNINFLSLQLSLTGRSRV